MSFSLNYVWIQATRLPAPKVGQKMTCSIPQGLMDNVVAVAQAYPHVEVSIWVDICGVGKNTPRILQDLNAEKPTSNIIFKSLDDVPKYAHEPFFKEPFDGFVDEDGGNNTTFWRQHDLARLYAIQHVVRNLDVPVFYSDMDMALVERETIPKALKTLSTYGAVTGLPNPYTQVDCQFFGFTKRGVKFLEGAVIPMAEEETQRDELGWKGYSRAFHSAATKYIEGLRFAPLLNVGAVSIPASAEVKQSYQITNPEPSQFLPQQP